MEVFIKLLKCILSYQFFYWKCREVYYFPNKQDTSDYYFGIFLKGSGQERLKAYS